MSAIGFPVPHFEPGIYFDMPDTDYHSDPSLSNSGCKHLIVSALDYWLNSRLNPNYDDKPTDALIFGRAAHCFLLEGAEAFAARFAVEPSKADHPDAIDGAKALRAYAVQLRAERGLPTKGIGKTIEDLCFAIREHDSDVPLWPLIKAEFENSAADQTILSAKDATELKLGMYVLAHMPSVAQAFSGGYPEVSVFWRDKESGAPMKARFDYLRHSAIVDLKTFTNKLRLPVEQAAVRAITAERYDLQPPIYLDAMQNAHALYQEHGDKVVHGEVDPTWLKRLMAKPPQRFIFVLLQKGGTPEIVSREFARTERKGASANGYFINGERAYRRAVKLYTRCVAELGIDQPWIIDRPTRPLLDAEFPLYALDRETEEEESAA